VKLCFRLLLKESPPDDSSLRARFSLVTEFMPEQSPVADSVYHYFSIGLISFFIYLNTFRPFDKHSLLDSSFAINA